MATDELAQLRAKVTALQESKAIAAFAEFDEDFARRVAAGRLHEAQEATREAAYWATATIRQFLKVTCAPNKVAGDVSQDLRWLQIDREHGDEPVTHTTRDGMVNTFKPGPLKDVQRTAGMHRVAGFMIVEAIAFTEHVSRSAECNRDDSNLPTLAELIANGELQTESLSAAECLDIEKRIRRYNKPVRADGRLPWM